ncbi:rhomboid-like protein [Litorisediminicola beolgyonensis]|uniref:Rhomboid-like protein n=1 Tax=Litorisediminicola beolgyonensis TaxID=1173614 RepID=A0ABW3ZHJ5_9RHOB
MSRPDPGAVGACLRRVPVTLVFLCLMLAANALAGTLSGHIDPELLANWGIGVEALKDGKLLRFVTAVFLSHDLSMALRQLVFAASVIGAVEWRFGSWRAAGLFFALDVTATLVLLAAVAVLPVLATLAATTDLGMSMGGFGLIGVLIGTRARAGWWLAAVLALIGLKYAASPDPLADLGHAIALVIGFSIQRSGLLGGENPRRG